jgi:hypothetical protein
MGGEKKEKKTEAKMLEEGDPHRREHITRYVCMTFLFSSFL